MNDPDPLTADDIIRLLALVPLVTEGGYFRETYRSGITLPSAALPEGYAKSRSAGSAIYYLLTSGTFSVIHRLRADEVYHFYAGDPVELLQLHTDGRGEVIVLGNDLAKGMRPQVVVPGGAWQGSRLAKDGRFALMGTTMAPGFDSADSEVGDRTALLRAFPAFAGLITALTAGEEEPRHPS